MRQRTEHFLHCLGSRTLLLFLQHFAHFVEQTIPAATISQIQTDRQFRLRKIPALLRHGGANLLHCRSPFYLCLEHVDNLGAYTASRPETGLLIPSVYINNPTFAAERKR
jgi:hypothetical protein